MTIIATSRIERNATEKNRKHGRGRNEADWFVGHEHTEIRNSLDYTK